MDLDIICIDVPTDFFCLTKIKRSPFYIQNFTRRQASNVIFQE